MNEQKTQQDFQDMVLDLDEVDMSENKINPQYYIHLAILNVQNSYLNVDLRTGILRFILNVQQLESILVARGLSDKYETELKILIDNAKKEEGTILPDIKKADVFLAQNKFKLLLEEVFSQSKLVKSLKH